MKFFLSFLLFLSLCVASVQSHAYFSWPPARAPYCTDAVTCAFSTTANAPTGTPQGVIWLFPPGTSLTTGMVSSSCETDAGLVPGMNFTTPNDTPQSVLPIYQPGSVIAIEIFVSQNHINGYSATNANTDGWTIRGRDATVAGSTFQPLSYPNQGVDINGNRLGQNWNGSALYGSNNLWDSRYFVAGSTLTVYAYLPNIQTTDYELQLYWGSSLTAGGGVGVAWLSCADVQLMKSGATSYFGPASGLPSFGPRMAVVSISLVSFLVAMVSHRIKQ